MSIGGLGHTVPSRSAGKSRTDKDDGDDASRSGDEEEEEGGRQSSSSRQNDEKNRKQLDLLEKMKREQHVLDKVWLSGVGVVILVALVISASGKLQRS